MPNRAIEFHDSTLDSVTVNGSDVVLHFSSAYIHQSDGNPGWDAGSGWVQEARLHISGASLTGGISNLPCDLWDGRLRLDGKLSEMLPIPLDYQGHVQLDLEEMETLRIFGTYVRLELVGEASYVEEFSGNG